jgi:hypothetical protein
VPTQCRAGYESSRLDAIGILCGTTTDRACPSDYLITKATLSGDKRRSACAKRAVGVFDFNRSNRPWGSCAGTIGGIKRLRRDRHKGVRVKSWVHHRRQRNTVLRDIPNSRCRSWALALSGGEDSINTVAK